jgi:hypothetical protein
MWVHIRLNWIITHDIPALWSRIVADAKQIAADIAHIYDLAVAYALKLYRQAVQLLDDLRTWVEVHVLEPLSDLVSQLRTDLLKWGFFAYQLLTNPPKLAALLIKPIVAAAEAVFWDIAAPVGKFAFGIILKDSAKFAALIETILSAVI